MRENLLPLYLAAAVVLAPHAFAEELGLKGQTYQPDPDAREEMKNVIREKARTGELDAFWNTYRDKTIAAVKHPASLGLPVSYAPHTSLQPVRFTLPTSYADARGNVIAPAGTVIEPLRRMPLRYGLVFIDGNDQRQVDYAIARGRQEPLKIVLTAGSAFDLRLRYQHAAWPTGTGIPFYFDQRKIIINALAQLYGIDIATVPVVMTQQGVGVKVEYGIGG